MTADQSTAPRSETPMPETSGKPLSLHDVAPYPTGPDGITANSLGVHYAAFALMHHTLAFEIFDFDKEREAYDRSSNMAILAYKVAHLLHALSNLGAPGDMAALEMHIDANCPPFNMDLAAWLADGGVDPNQVIKVAEEMAWHHRAKAAAPAPTSDVHPAQVPLPLGEEQP